MKKESGGFAGVLGGGGEVVDVFGVEDGGCGGCSPAADDEIFLFDPVMLDDEAAEGFSSFLVLAVLRRTDLWPMEGPRELWTEWLE